MPVNDAVPINYHEGSTRYTIVQIKNFSKSTSVTKIATVKICKVPPTIVKANIC